jgi:hypothetical protein
LLTPSRCVSWPTNAPRCSVADMLMEIALALGVMILFAVALDAIANAVVGVDAPERDYAARMRRRARIRRIAERRVARRLERRMPSARLL